MSVLDKIRKMKDRGDRRGNRSPLRGIFHDWQDGPNNVRLCGDFLEVKTHFIAPAPKRNDPGLCQADAFKGDDRIQMVINCPDWDVGTEEAKAEKTCPICKLHAIANQVLAENPGPAEKKQYDKLRSDTRQRTLLKWNVLDRDNPNIKKIEDGEEAEVLGFKIASVGMEAWDDINGIFDQCKVDISGVEEGVDICVTKAFDAKKKRVAYTAQAIIEGTSLKVTPLTKEERELELHDLLKYCGKQTDPQRVIDALHGDFRDIYELALEEEEADNEVAATGSTPDPDPAPAPAPAPAADPAAEEDGDAIGEEDDDSPFGAKKK
jgi:ribosomal protein L12E/L44/L45/RPP1/RPP2